MSTASFITAPPWNGFHLRRSNQGPPLIPHPEVCAFIRRWLRDVDGRVLLLGATPELIDLVGRTVAVDSSADSLEFIWPGNTSTRSAVRANWLTLPYQANAFSGVIGDGSLNCLVHPDGYRQLFDEIARTLRPRSRVVIRCYVRPDTGESIAQIRNEVFAGRVGHVDALKWRLAHALCAAQNESNLPVGRIRDAFEELFPDRELLQRLTGWSHAQIARVDAYAASRDIFSFPTARQLLEAVPAAFERTALRRAGTYELAERCPMFVMERRSS
jgi:SAM-dependent methyltransferase